MLLQLNRIVKTINPIGEAKYSAAMKVIIKEKVVAEEKIRRNNGLVCSKEISLDGMILDYIPPNYGASKYGAAGG